jgi:hypothetical protein
VNGDVHYDLVGGSIPFDTLYRLDQLAATLTGHLGWRVSVEIDPGITLTATPARDIDSLDWNGHAPARPSEAPLAPVQGQNAPAEAHTAPDASQGGTA